MSLYPTVDMASPDGKEPKALVVAVEPGSPADAAGFYPGCYVTSINDKPLRDSIDWRWHTCDDTIRVGYIDTQGESGVVELERTWGEDWGLSFEGVVFDGVKQCRNACTFCFMRQLPRGMRSSLSVRDDDFRLSFLAGTFITLTNILPRDEQRIKEQRISPLHVSLHAVDSKVRRELIGRHADHGLEVLERLLAAHIKVHAQIVLVPAVNDGSVLEETLRWAYARPDILDIGVVPLGFTKHQKTFSKSFNDALAARAVLDTLAPFQKRAEDQRGRPWVYAADEFYRNAYKNNLLDSLPSAVHYGDFSLFEDGVGIIRSYVDDWKENMCLLDKTAAVLTDYQKALSARGFSALFPQGALPVSKKEAIPRIFLPVYLVVGCAQREFLSSLLDSSSLKGLLEPLYVANEFFGGNVDVTGLLCGCDMVAAIRVCVEKKTSEMQGLQASDFIFCIPSIVFNNNGVTLDDMSLEDMEKATGVRLTVVSCNPSEFLPEIADAVLRV